MQRRYALLAGAFLFALAAAPQAPASELIARNPSHVTLRVDARGRAHVGYRAGGRTRHVVAWGAINARPPSKRVPQVHFRLRYDARGSRGGCLRYEGPPLAWLVHACRAPDGSYWALQKWQRLKPNYGGRRGDWELRLSHWRGPSADLEISVDWSYRRFDHLYGSLGYQGMPVFGFRATRSGSPLDTYGRNVYVDTFDSAYGRGWRRENSFLTHGPDGAFCYGFYTHGRRHTGAGRRYRATVIGPGVTPDVMWQGSEPGPYDRARDLAANRVQRALFAGDPRCNPN
jgi:hypothetical protein